MPLNIIDEELKQDILLKTNIVDIIGEFIKLKKTGSNFFALCPFHQEDNASFSVSQTLQIFNCFSCGKKGDVIQFLIEYKNMSFIDAVKTLASKLGVKISTAKVDNFAKLYHCLDLANNFFQATLRSSSGKKSSKLLQK